MKKFLSLYKSALFSYLIDPLFYVSSLLTILFCAFRFFFGSKFFVAGLGSTDLRPFFNSIPLISILTIPLLTFRLRSLFLDDSIPVKPFQRFFALATASFTAFSLPLLLLISIPLSVSRFGSVEPGQCLAGFLGLFLYGFSASALSAFFFAIFYSSSALPLIFSAVVLALVNFLHLLPLYVKTGSLLAFFCKAFSFAWHFDSFSKGILDSRNFFYYVAASFVLLLLSTHFEYKRLGKKSSRLTILLFTLILLFLSASSKNLYFRFDLTREKQFTVSPASKNLLSALESDLRITYFRSAELKNLYPQTEDVLEFLQDYASSQKNITLTLEKADEEKLKALGIQGQQIRHDNGTKTEFVTVYSAVLLQYLEKSSIIPFVLSTQTLEYDLSQRVQQFISKKERKLYLLCGNGRTIEESYMYVPAWLENRGFTVEVLNDFTATEVLKNLTASDQIAIFGTKDFSQEEAILIQNAIEKGCKAFFAASPFHTTIEDEWKISRHENDLLISYLNGKGFAFENALVEDISCYPLTMQSGEGSTAEYTTVNYPLWVALQNQKEAKQGATVFWASPLVLYNDAQPLLFTTNLAWLQKPASNTGEDLFLTNPFTLPKSAAQSDSQTGQFVVAAKKGNISLVSDQFFVSSLMTGFISGESTGDFRNYDYLTKELLNLRGEEELSALMQKSAPITALYKITDEVQFNSARKGTIALNFGLLPILILAMFVWVLLRRRGRR